MTTLSIREAVAAGHTIVFDTSILVEIWKADHASRRGVVPPVDVAKIPSPQRSVPSIVEWEFYRGSLPVLEINERRRWIRQTFSLLRLHTDVDNALRAMLERPIDVALPDALIAATCIARRAALLTLNTRHFLGFQELRLIDLPPS